MAVTAPTFEFETTWISETSPGQTPPPSDAGNLQGATDVAVDSEDNIYVVVSGNPSFCNVFDAKGNFLTSWGQDVLSGHVHGVTIIDDVVWTVENEGCAVRKFTLEGKLLATIGPSGEENRSDTGADWDSVLVPEGSPHSAEILATLKTIRPEGAGPYNHPTKLSMGPDGDLYVSDGYGNCKVHRFSGDGELKQSWGGAGIEPGEFHLVHSVMVHDNRVYVSDRENDRVQVFSLDGEYLLEWTDGIHSPNAVVYGPEDLYYVCQHKNQAGRFSFTNGISPEVQPGLITIHTGTGEPIGEVREPLLSLAVHGLAIDSQGDLYLCDRGGVGENGGRLDSRNLRGVNVMKAHRV